MGCALNPMQLLPGWLYSIFVELVHCLVLNNFRRRRSRWNPGIWPVEDEGSSTWAFRGIIRSKMRSRIFVECPATAKSIFFSYITCMCNIARSATIRVIGSEFT